LYAISNKIGLYNTNNSTAISILCARSQIQGTGSQIQGGGSQTQGTGYQIQGTGSQLQGGGFRFRLKGTTI
jgi:hypothetical protein